MNYNLIYPNLNFAHKTDVSPYFNEVFEKHFHLIYEIIFVVDGDVELVVENKSFNLHPGDIAFIKPGQYHNIQPAANLKYDRYVLKFPEYKIPGALLAELKDKPTCCSVGNTVMPELFKMMDWHYERYTGKDVNLLMESILTEVLTYFCAQGSHGKSNVSYLNSKMAEIIEYINENIAKPLQIADICEHFHYSKSYICKEFALCMGVPLKKYIRSKKVLLAESLLNSGLKPTQVYDQCGFADYSTFYRSYFKIIGKAPSSSDVSDTVDAELSVSPEKES